MTFPAVSRAGLPASLRRVAVPAIRSLRRRWRTALLLAALGAVTLGATLPIAALMRPGEIPSSRLSLGPALPPDDGLPWPAEARTPARTRAAALAVLFELLVVVTAASLIAGGVAVLTLSATQGADRAGEMSVRRAVGASRRALAGAVLLEGLAVAAAAAMAGGPAGWAGTLAAAGRWTGPLLPGRPGAAGAAALIVGAAIVLGALLALIFAPRRRLVDAEPQPLGLYAAVVQLGICLAVLATAGQLARHATTSFSGEGRAAGTGRVFQLSLPAGPQPDKAHQYAAALQTIRHQTGAGTVSLAESGAVAGLGTVATITTDCGVCSQGGLRLPWHVRAATHLLVSADTFEAEGIRLLAGRKIDDRDNWEAPRVAVVSRRVAQEDFQNGDAIGRQLMVGDDRRTWYTVVGVADDRVPPGFGAGLQPPATVYLSVLQQAPTRLELLLRGGEDRSAPGAVRAAFPGAGVQESTEAALLAAERAPLVWFGRWFGLEGIAMLVLAGAGTFVVMRLWVVSLYPELGLRRSVGARRRHVVARIAGRAALAGAAGVMVGAWLGPGLWDSLRASLPGLAAWDQAWIIRLGLLLLATTLAGAMIPAWRAIREPPVALLEPAD